MNLGGVSSWLKRTYDRIIASVVLLALFVSLIMLAVYAQSLKGSQQAFDDQLNGLKPKFAEAAKADTAAFDAAHKALTAPPQTGEWKNHMLIPELRVKCVNCERPIAYAATVCYYCKTPQPEAPKEKPRDSDSDGMPDEWENAHKLNPLDPEDAKIDTDKDGFANIEEFNFKTDPQDPASYPPPIAKINVGKITPIPFALVFKGVSRLEGKSLYQLNLRRGGKTYWAAIGDTVEGFKVVSYDEKAEGGPTLTIERAGKQIPLVKGKVVPRSEYEVVLVSGLDGTNYTVRVDSEFDVKGIKYQVKGVDTEANRVLIHDPSRDMDVWIGGDASKTPSPEVEG